MSGEVAVELPLDERMYYALTDALGGDEDEAQAALDVVLRLFADDLRETASEVEWRFRGTTFHRGGCKSETRLHPAGQFLRDRADALHVKADQ